MSRWHYILKNDDSVMQYNKGKNVSGTYDPMQCMLDEEAMEIQEIVAILNKRRIGIWYVITVSCMVIQRIYALD